MPSMTTVLIIVVAVALIGFLIYSQTQNKGIMQYADHFQQKSNDPCPHCSLMRQQLSLQSNNNPGSMNIAIDTNNDPYSDPIKRQDLHGMYDPLTYPQLRLPREVLDKYNEYYERNGEYPNFNQHHKPMFDNPILNGILIKQIEPNEPFGDDIPTTIPLFKVKSQKNTNRFYYYILDQRTQSKLELKIPLDNVKVNGHRYNNGEFYGLPELYDDDIIENVIIFPNAKFKLMLYKTFSYP